MTTYKNQSYLDIDTSSGGSYEFIGIRNSMINIHKPSKPGLIDRLGFESSKSTVLIKVIMVNCYNVTVNVTKWPIVGLYLQCCREIRINDDSSCNKLLDLHSCSNCNITLSDSADINSFNDRNIIVNDVDIGIYEYSLWKI